MGPYEYLFLVHRAILLLPYLTSISQETHRGVLVRFGRFSPHAERSLEEEGKKKTEKEKVKETKVIACGDGTDRVVELQSNRAA